ncbi:F-box only protein 42 [Prorops nasuta]|uniref:F-box only protein 42 n=1 Tax=Prorops nasuta TaxID=863751 RepID=UPI0034CD3349
MQCKMDDLPDELLEYILSLIPPYKALEDCKLVSKRWCRATRNVIEHNQAHFQKSIAFGTLFWNSCSHTDWVPTISKRHSHSACTYKNSMYVFGGCTATCTTFNDLWRLDLDSRTWVRLITMGSYPSPKACATMLRYKKKLILFGGWSHPSPYPLHQQWKLFNEVHVYSIETSKWTSINTLETPPPISAHSASVHGNIMVVFGGICNGYSFEVVNDVWCLNLSTYCWHKQATSNVKPHPRYGQSQIPLGDKYLLILGGWTGPNVPMNDAWLLNMEGPIWIWKEVNMKRTESAPTRVWGNQACKVGNYIIVLSKNKRQAKSNDMSISLSKVICQRTSSSLRNNSRERHKYVETEKDENVNGRHGTLPRLPPKEKDMLSQNGLSAMKTIPLANDNNFSMAAFREERTQTSGATANRQRQLESLRKMEEKIQKRKHLSRTVKQSENTLSIFVLDISKMLYEECSATWIPLKCNKQTGPDERVLYSLVVGRGELIVFGGIRKEQATIQGQPDIDDSEVYNDLHFITPPRYVI